jgi:hypothetical protein
LPAFWLTAAAFFSDCSSFTIRRLMDSQIILLTDFEVLLEALFTNWTNKHLIEVLIDFFAVMAIDTEVLSAEH